jgi:hypothetical protein
LRVLARATTTERGETMSQSRRLYSSLGVGELLTAKAALLLLLGAVVATTAVFYGNAYASHGHVEEEAEHADEEAEAGEAAEEEEEEHAEEEEADEGSRSLKVTEGILISTAGAGLVPLGLLLARRRTRSVDEPALQGGTEAPAAGPPEPSGGSSVERVLRPALALLSVGAAVIHFVVIPGHWDEYWGQGLFFIIAAIAQILWAVWVVVAPSRLLYLLGALGNAAIVALWVVTRTYGVPAGPGAGEAEAVEFTDTLATVFEVLLVGGALVLARTAPTRPIRWPAGALTATVVLALLVAALTAASLLSLVEL